MESSFNSSGTDPVLLLKERIIKTETLLDKYACLTRKFIDLEKAHSEAIENEKKAKKDASKYLEKYCKLAKKSNCLLIKIKTLEDDIHAKTNELKESQDEYAKLESVLQVYKTERKGHQCLKKDRDFLLTALWKVLKRLEEEPKENKSKKMAETFFKRFERELIDLKLEDFRYNKVKNASRPTEKEESEFLYSPGSQALDSVESDFIDTDLAPESVKSSFESDENCIIEKIKRANSNQRMVDTEHQNNVKTPEEVNILKNQSLPLPDLSLESFIYQDAEERIDSNLQEKYISKDSVYVHTLEDNGFNLSQNVGQEGCLTSLNFQTKGSSTSDIVTQQNVQDEEECFQNSLNLTMKCFPQESKDNLCEEEKMPEQYRKTYCSQKFKFSSRNDEAFNEKLFNSCGFTNTSSLHNRTNTILNAISNIKSSDIDVFNDSTDTINIGIDDVAVEDIGSIPHHFQYCETIYDFLTSSGEMSHPKQRTLNDEDCYLLFLAESELDNKPSEVHFDVEKTPIRKPPQTVSVFDVEDNESFTPGCVRDEELANICVEFDSDSGSMIDSRKVLNTVREMNAKNDVIEHYEISRKPENENQSDEKSQKISSPSLEESDINCNPNRIFDSTITKNSPNLEFTEQGDNISDEEIYRILKDFKNVTLLSPIEEKEPSQRREVFVSQSSKRDNCNVSRVVKVMSNLKNMESREEMLHNKPDRYEETLFCYSKTDEEREKKMVDKSIQTDEVFFEERKKERQSNRTGGEMVFPEPVMRKLCKIVWKRNFKKFKHLNNFGNCLDFMKTVLEMINRPRLYFRNRTTENYYLMEKTIGKSKNLKCDERKMSSWQVEDVEATNVISKSEPAFSYPKVEDCNFFTQVPAHYYSKDRLNNSTLKSEEMRSQKNKMCLNCFTSEQQMGFATPTRGTSEVGGNICKCLASRRCVDSDIALRRCLSNDVVNDSEERCKSSAKSRDTTEDLGYTQESVLENAPVADVNGSNWDAGKTETDHLEKYVDVKNTGFKPGEMSSEREESAVLRRSSRIHSRNTLLIKETNDRSNCSLTYKGSHNLMKVDFFGVSLPSMNGTCTESHETSSNKSNSDVLQAEKVSEGTKSSRLKDKFEELFGEPESQLDCSLIESGEDPKTTFTTTEVQKQVSVTLEINANGYNSDATTVSKRRRVFSVNSKSGSTNNNKKMKLDLPCAGNDEDLEGRCTHNEVPLNDTFSFQGITTNDNANILDSIMTAMTKQNELFKTQTPIKETEVIDANHQNIRFPLQSSQPKDSHSKTFNSVHRKICNEHRMKGDNVAFLNVPYYWNLDNHFGDETFKEKKNDNSEGNRRKDAKVKPLVEKEIRNFLKLDINTVEEGEEKVKSVITVLRNASEDIIANTIVNEIMANVDEDLQEFERPAPPLTQTQHRIMIILTVFSISDEQFHRISSKILKIIRSKIFPENFFWPDDSLEMATRFYAALCKRMNDVKGIWKFCFKVITSMRQRWCIPILVVLQVWPDIIHNANEVENNILVKTFVNIILYTPKSEDMRRKRQEQKLLAIKHLMINFYNFDMNSTIEGFTQKLWESFVHNTQGSLDALILISKCRNWLWTRKNVIAKLLETLESWMNGNSQDTIVSEVLDVLQQITEIFPDVNTAEASSAKDVVSVLARILDKEITNPTLKEKIIRILCSLCHYSNVRDVLVPFSEKLSTSEPLYADIKKALSLKNRRCKEGFKKVNTKTAWKQKKKTKPKRKEKKKKKNSSHQKSVLDIK